MANPPEGMEWVDEQLVEKTGITLKHSEFQSLIGILVNCNRVTNRLFCQYRWVSIPNRDFS